MGKGLLFIVMAVLTGTAVIVHGSQRTAFDSEYEVSKFEGEVIVREIARSAMNRAVGEARRNFAQAETIAYADTPYQSGTYDVSSERLSGSSVVLESVGRLGSHDYVIQTTLKEISPLDAVLNIDTDDLTVSFSGNSFVIDGHDTNPPSKPHGDASEDNDKHAIHTRTDAAQETAIDALSSGQFDNVRGIGGNKDIISSSYGVDFEALYDEVISSCTETITDGRINGNTTFGSPSMPAYVHVNDDLRINGNTRGYGVLVVDGDVTASGNLTWEGVVIVRGNSGRVVDFGGSAEVYGAVVLLGSGGSAEADYTIRGNAQLYYSSVTLERLYEDLSILDAARDIVIVDQWQSSVP